MPRNLPSLMIAPITSNAFQLAILLDLTTATGIVHAWSGAGSITWNGNTYLGVGSFGGFSEVSEASETRADGTSVMLSGIDSALLTDTLSDLQQGAAATLWLAVFSASAIVAAYSIFSGQTDKATITVSPDTFSIEQALESRMTDLARPTMRRYTMADQRTYYSNDIGFSWIEILNDVALLWG